MEKSYVLFKNTSLCRKCVRSRSDTVLLVEFEGCRSHLRITFQKNNLKLRYKPNWLHNHFLKKTFQSPCVTSALKMRFFIFEHNSRYNRQIITILKTPFSIVKKRRFANVEPSKSWNWKSELKLGRSIALVPRARPERRRLRGKAIHRRKHFRVLALPSYLTTSAK